MLRELCRGFRGWRQTFCLLLLVGGTQALAEEIAVVGPVEKLSCSQRSLQVIGIRYVATDTASEVLLCSAGSPSELIYVAVQGNLSSDGSLAISKLQILSKGEYVPGVTPVYVRGIVDSPRTLTSLTSVSGALIEGVSDEIEQGTILEVLGTQPLLGGYVLASVQKRGAYAGTLSSSGSGSRRATIDSSSGSGRFSSSGSGALKDQQAFAPELATDIFSSSGSGRASANLSSSSGSGILSSSGSGVLSSSGSGILSSSGSGAHVLSSSGSGIARY
jgi:hypothetical protein